MGSFARWVSLFEGAELRRISLVLGVATVDGLFQALGVASIMPFIAILSDPSLAETSRFFVMLTEVLPQALRDNLVWVTGLSALAILVLSNALSILDYWLSLRLFSEQRYRLSMRLLSLYLGKELLDFNRRKVADMSTTILSEVERVVFDTLMAGANLLADIIVTLAIIGLLFYANPLATVMTVSILGGGYLLVHLITMSEVERLGRTHARAEAGMFASVSQALALFKDAKILGKGAYFMERFGRPARDVVRTTNRYEILTFIPAQLIEVLAFGLILTMALYLSGQTQTDFNTVGMIAFYAFATYRLVPVLKSLLDGFESIRYSAGVVEKIAAELAAEHTATNEETAGRLQLRESIRLEQIAFRYPDAPTMVFEGLDAAIPAGRLTCVIGPSGAGKSTLLDMLLGLIEPTKGRCLIDGVPLNEASRRQWQRGIGYVPQQVQLIDGTLAQNIALGETVIDEARVQAAATAAGIHRFAEEQLVRRYDTGIGDGGHVLSSGERQRVGIARSLYHDPDVLLLDEATNELDAETEALVLSQLLGLSGKTIIFVSHKQAISQRADYLVELAGPFK